MGLDDNSCINGKIYKWVRVQYLDNIIDEIKKEGL